MMVDDYAARSFPMRLNRHSPLQAAVIGGSVTAGLLCICLYRLGWPLTVYTWVVLMVCGLSGLSLGLRGRLGRVLYSGALIAALYLAIPRPFQLIPFIEKWGLFDTVGARTGWKIPPGLSFGGDGANTALLQSYLGDLEPQWRVEFSLSPWIRDGNERVHSRNLLRQEYFPQVLEMLPSDSARKQVITALSDPLNLLRVHQGLLLACLLELGYPADTDRDSWWLHHRELFVSTHDPYVAAALTHNWRNHIERLYSGGSMPAMIRGHYAAAGYQERGAWGGDRRFAEAVMAMHLGQLEGDPALPKLGGGVVWWQE